VAAESTYTSFSSQIAAILRFAQDDRLYWMAILGDNSNGR